MHRLMFPGVHAQPLSQVKLPAKICAAFLHPSRLLDLLPGFSVPTGGIGPWSQRQGAESPPLQSELKAMWLPCWEFMVSLVREDKKAARTHLQELPSPRAAASIPSGEVNGKPLVQRGFSMSFALFTLL